MGTESEMALAQIVGSWMVDVTWSDGTQGKFDITFNPNGTLAAAVQQLHGRWFQIGDHAVFSFAGYSGLVDWSLVYSLTLNRAGNRFTGVHGYSHTSGNPKGENTGNRTSKAEGMPDDLRAVLGPGHAY